VGTEDCPEHRFKLASGAKLDFQRQHELGQPPYLKETYFTRTASQTDKAQQSALR
jgi:hypothetical protein